jgi:hypothetical protein
LAASFIVQRRLLARNGFERVGMKRAISLVVFGALLSILQGNASADEQSLNDQCRAKIRAQIKGPACQKSQPDKQSDSCYIGGLEAAQAKFYARTALCVDRRKSRTHVARKV